MTDVDPNAEGLEQWVGAHVVAEHLSLDYQTVLLYARLGKIPGAKIGRAWRFRLSAVDEFLSRPKDPWLQSAQSRGRKRRI